MFGWFSNKKEIKEIKEETRKSFDLVKKDITAVSGWIKHLDSEKKIQQNQIEGLIKEISSIKEELEGTKNVISFIGDSNLNRVFKTSRKNLDKQTPVLAVQTGVQTGVQTPILNQFPLAERAILIILLNTEQKFSYEDLALMMNKEKSTLRGQINSIRQKNPGIIEEQIEQNGKKRVFIPVEIKEKMLKKAKVRVNLEKNA